MDKSRRAAKVPRRKASQENQAPTLIIVKDYNRACFIDRAEQVDKNQCSRVTAVLQSRTKYFFFKQSHHSS